MSRRGIAQLVARCVRDAEALGSSPSTPTTLFKPEFPTPVFSCVPAERGRIRQKTTGLSGRLTWRGWPGILRSADIARPARQVRKSLFFLISHPIPVNFAQKLRRHDTAGCGSGKFFIFAPYCLAAHFLHWNYFTQGSHIVYILRHSRPFPNPAAAFSGLIDRQPGYFLSSTRRTYPIRPPEQVRKSTFFR